MSSLTPAMFRRLFRWSTGLYAIGGCILILLSLKLRYLDDTAYDPNTYIVEILSQDEVLRYQKGWSIQDDAGLLHYIRQRWLLGPSVEKYRLKSKSDQDVSQMGQSKFVDKLLGQRKNGFFVECGAANGESFSNTLFLERMRGWTGLLIEANPEYFAELLTTRRNVYSINACLSVKNETDQVTFRTAGLFGGLANKMDETHLRYGHDDVIKWKRFPRYWPFVRGIHP